MIYLFIAFNRSNEALTSFYANRIQHDGSRIDIYVYYLNTRRVEDLNDRGNGRLRLKRPQPSVGNRVYRTVDENGGKSFFDYKTNVRIRYA